MAWGEEGINEQSRGPRPFAGLRRRLFQGRGGRAEGERSRGEGGSTAGDVSGEEDGEGEERRVSREGERGRYRGRLACLAQVEVGVVVPPPFSLLPVLLLRRGASVLLATLMSGLVNRFLDLLLEDYARWMKGTGRGEGSLLGYSPDRFVERRVELEAEEGEEEEEGEELEEPEYMI